MAFYIGTSEDCSAYNSKVNTAMSWRNHITRNWSAIIANAQETEYAVVAKEGIEPEEGSALKLVQQLPEDWDNAPT